MVARNTREQVRRVDTPATTPLLITDGALVTADAVWVWVLVPIASTRGGRRPGPGHHRHRPGVGDGPTARCGLSPQGDARPAHRAGLPAVQGRVRLCPLPRRGGLYRPRRPPHRPERGDRSVPAEGGAARDPLPRHRSRPVHDDSGGTPDPVDRRRVPPASSGARRPNDSLRHGPGSTSGWRRSPGRPCGAHRRRPG